MDREHHNELTRKQAVIAAGIVGCVRVITRGDMLPPERVVELAALIGMYDSRGREIANVIAGVPYPMHCLTPETCAGKGSCPRDPTCVD